MQSLAHPLALEADRHDAFVKRGAEDADMTGGKRMDEAEIAAIGESIELVLGDLCGSLAVHGFIDGHSDLDRTLWRQAGQLGWLALSLPEEKGGIGMGARGAALLHSALGQAVAPGPFMATAVATEVLAASAQAESSHLVASALAGDISLAIAAHLPADGVANQTDLMLLGNADAAAALVPGDDGAMLLFAMDQIDVQPIKIWDETRSMLRASTPVAAPVEVLAGARPAFERAFALAIAADSAGIAQGIFDRTIAYMKEREQFGRAIGSFQALKHRAANLSLKAIAAQQMVAQAASHVDAGLDGADIWCAIAKAEVTEIATFVAGDSVQLHGGVGFTREYDPHLYLKRARLNEMLLARNPLLRDRAADALARTTAQGLAIMEIAG